MRGNVTTSCKNEEKYAKLLQLNTEVSTHLIGTSKK
jgi:hypothetical protein